MNEFYPYGGITAPTFQQPQSQQPQPIQSRILNVNGRVGAEKINLAPESSIFLLDSKDPVIWLVTTDSAATKTITKINATIEEENTQEAAAPVVTDKLEEKLDDVIKRITDLEKRFDSWEA